MAKKQIQMAAVEETAARPPKKSRKKLVIAVIAAAAVFAWFKFGGGSKKEIALKAENFAYAPVESRTIKQTVSANGNINPVNVVSVGAQVSGIVDKIYVDYNDKVKKGQLLAEIDKSTILEEYAANKAKVSQAEASLDLAKRNFARNSELYESGYIARIELDTANVDLANAESNLVSAKSALKRSELNLGYSEIRSPVSGVVISKDVERGQTIAASFSAPTLFKIAEDLKKMQIETSISEADIGNIKAGQPVDFTVDAFPLETFKGNVQEIRLDPKTEQNVVVYNVIIGISNPDGKLLPGMTAFVDINTLALADVSAVPNAALQWRPDETISEKVDYPEEKKLVSGEAYLYTFANGRVKANKVRRGITDGSYTEIKGGFDGEVIVEYNLDKGVKKSAGTAKPGNKFGSKMSGAGRS